MKNKYPHLTEFSNELIEEYRIYLDHKPNVSQYWKTKALEKFVKGREEYEEQDIMDIDCPYEIMMEEIDIDAYEFIERIQERFKEKERENNPLLKNK